MFQLLDRTLTNSTTTQPKSEFRTLIYRGMTYKVPKRRSVEALDRLAQIAGQRLIYRGETYQIVPTTAPTAAVATEVRQLTYRATTYDVIVQSR